jgi:hypothetical protein
MDVHVHQAITLGLRRWGVDVLTAQEDGAATLPDADLMDRATSLGRVLFTYDNDHLLEAARRQSEGIHFTGLIYISLRKVDVGRCIADLLALLRDPWEDRENTVEYLPLRPVP